MPEFTIGDEIVGITGPETAFSIPTRTDKILVSLILRHNFFGLPNGGAVEFVGRFLPATSVLHFSLSESNTKLFWGRKLSLLKLELKIKTCEVESGMMVVDYSAENPIQVNGRAEWNSGAFEELGVSHNRIPLEISYQFDTAGKNSGLRFNLHANSKRPLKLIEKSSTLKNGVFAITENSTGDSFLFTLKSEGIKSKRESLDFTICEEIARLADNRPGGSLGIKYFERKPKSTKPEITVVPPEDREVGFVYSLSKTTSDNMENREAGYSFEDFLSTLAGWKAGYEKIKEMIKNDDVDGLLDLISGDKIKNLQENPDQPTIESIFRNIFKTTQEEGKDSPAFLGKIWDAWFANTGDEPQPNKLLRLLNVIFDEIKPDFFRTILDTLHDSSYLTNLKSFIKSGLGLVLQNFDDSAERFLSFWATQLDIAGIKNEPDKLAASLLDSLKEKNGETDSYRSLGDLPVLSDSPVFKSSIFKMRSGTMLTALGLQGMALASGLASVPASAANDEMRNFFAPVNNWLQTALPAKFSLSPAALLKIFHALVHYAEGDEEAEITLMEMSRFFPLGVLLPISLALINLVRFRLPWPDMLFRSIEEDESVSTIRLEPPGPDRKYLIISDIHRDQESDDRGLFEFGSIDHFSANQQLYADILDYAFKENWTVIELGDCDELWFIRDFAEFRDQGRFEGMMQRIMKKHDLIYRRLAKLYKEKRYVRVFGNHDSYIRKPEIFKLFQEKFDDPELEFYDYVIIPGVKTMDDFGFIDLLKDIWHLRNSPNRTVEIFEKICEGRLGLDSRPYSNKKPMILAHGHQWDFWNCDKNSLIGKMFANSMAVWIDSVNDPFLDLGGLSMAGTPLVKFGSLFSQLPVFNSFLSYNPARKLAHRIQHQNESERYLIDDMFYFESLTALMSMFALPLSIEGENGELIPWSEAVKAVRNKEKPLKSLFEHLMNHLCIGHTHYPQSMPYLNIESWLCSPPLAGNLGCFVNYAKDRIAGFTGGYRPCLNFFKMLYHNTGTAGWQDGVVWALRIDETGQPRLIYWTRDTKVEAPQEMDWDIPLMNDDVREALEDKKAQIIEYLKKQPAALAQNLPDMVAPPAAVPREMVVDLAEHIASTQQMPAIDLDKPEQNSPDSLSHVLLNLLLSLLARQGGEDLPSQSFEVTIELPAAVLKQLKKIQSILDGFVDDDSRVSELSLSWLLFSQGLPLNSEKLIRPLNQERRGSLLNTSLMNLLTLNSLFPGLDDETHSFGSTLKIEDDRLKLLIEVKNNED